MLLASWPWQQSVLCFVADDARPLHVQRANVRQADGTTIHPGNNFLPNDDHVGGAFDGAETCIHTAGNATAWNHSDGSLRNGNGDTELVFDVYTHITTLAESHDHCTNG